MTSPRAYAEAVEIAQHGARSVIGIDTQEGLLDLARQRARDAGVDAYCKFAHGAPEPVDLVIALDSFEHFDKPEAVLREMHSMLRPGGCVIACFGPTWYHPLGGHLFSVFPWAHLIFTEKALIRWRADFKSDGATRFSEVAGGLNRMTIRRFEELVNASPLMFQQLELVPIRKLRAVANRITREFTTAMVKCRLVARQ
jgi:SAM-dependent methyltransferase